MEVIIKKTDSILTKSKLPDADYVINPYIGCPHACIYCYAEFMKRFTGHSEPWGKFLEVKQFTDKHDFRRIPSESTILIGSVTDAYNPYEAEYCVTKALLRKLAQCSAKVEILTKSKLVCRDMEELKCIPNVTVGISLNTTDDVFRRRTEPFASSVEDRIQTLRTLHDNGISTYLFVAPLFPGISDYEELLQRVKDCVDYVCFENLNLRGSYRVRVLDMITEYYPDRIPLFEKIYRDGDFSYWDEIESAIRQYCSHLQLNCRTYFHHGPLNKPEKKR